MSDDNRTEIPFKNLRVVRHISKCLNGQILLQILHTAPLEECQLCSGDILDCIARLLKLSSNLKLLAPTRNTKHGLYSIHVCMLESTQRDVMRVIAQSLSQVTKYQSILKLEPQDANSFFNRFRVFIATRLCELVYLTVPFILLQFPLLSFCRQNFPDRTPVSTDNTTIKCASSNTICVKQKPQNLKTKKHTHTHYVDTYK